MGRWPRVASCILRRSLQMKAWNLAPRAGEMQPGRQYDLAFTVEEDTFSAARGYAPWQATMKELQAKMDALRKELGATDEK